MMKYTFIVGWIIFLIIIIIGSYGILHYESFYDHATIVTYEDALWWSINVASAVGDCDICPKTTGGRVISTIMMMFGYALFSLNIGITVALFKQEIEDTRKSHK